MTTLAFIHASEDHDSSMATVLENLATSTGSDRTTVDALTKALPELTHFTQNQVAEPRRPAWFDILAGIAPATHVFQKQRLLYIEMYVSLHLNGKITRPKTTITVVPTGTISELTTQGVSVPTVQTGFPATPFVSSP
jgi:hypothetical protein